MKRTNQKITLHINDMCDMLCGTTNKHQPKVIYVSGKTWVEPMQDKDYNLIINNIFINFKKELYKRILNTHFFDKNFITNFEITQTSLKLHKKSFLNFEIYLRQKNDILLLQDLKEKITLFFKPLINDLIADFKNNSLILTKGKH